jgi:hypothetical protein
MRQRQAYPENVEFYAAKMHYRQSIIRATCARVPIALIESEVCSGKRTGPSQGKLGPFCGVIPSAGLDTPITSTQITKCWIVPAFAIYIRMTRERETKIRRLGPIPIRMGLLSVGPFY